MDTSTTPIIELRDITKSYGAFDALRGVNLSVASGEVTCVLGDNGAGKSTLIKILSGLHKQTSGELLIDGQPVTFSGPRAALDNGIATVHQNLAVVGQMSVWRNFFLGQELTGFLGRLRESEMRSIAQEQLKTMGIDLPDIDVEVESLSGGQRQVVAIARAVYFGARVIILDEPTAALGVKQSSMVLRFVAAARDKGLGVVLITHNPHHAYLVGDRFTILNLGNQILNASRDQVTLEQLTQQMAGGGELEALSHELSR
ncbi:ATP-binding cassette domain-containing protein [Corynebacterium pseudotuberculosis]|uniref:ATP-binding cassette domain-containing protein n=1 Tax=Corynebacterium pseudotuberculosis (strain C231) TaxID=681645 RepID=D9QD71_CORP2|nr:ATP-binding cassette domain-containing protein [Corynebacterium pseudotuberculosis]ADL09515.1 ATP-binding cassette domain-containing protein [Corynebacterium pseudotuberculosis C231]ADO25314.1 ATP-binding cassette domain-containing protein [Corynebacterium pseudotuberculosis I19]AEK91362.1 Ribose import ATP-binding protein RbsA [Corynebacterium pseudotuberculosis PAT10]AEP69296.1 Ribose import ATP-binding protein RbsA [Corynebacterium pseudotuberculosis 42/02-A]AFF21184.1 Ribose import ATP-